MTHFYSGKHVLVTGGLGFIGSNLALRLAELGATVTVVDSKVPGCGGNPFNLAGTPGRIWCVQKCISDPALESALADVSLIFNLAGEVSHTHSMQCPERDLAINQTDHLAFLKLCARVLPGVRIVYAGTRQVYGVPQALPVDESHPVAPIDFNGVHKAATGQYHLMLSRLGKIDALVLRLTNIYGPRMAIGLGCQGFLPVFTNRAIRGVPLEVFGDGLQMRDPVYVEDACEAFLRAGMVRSPRQRTLNAGSTQPWTLKDIADEFSRQAGLPPSRLREFPADRKPIDIGSYATCTAACQEELGWRATTTLQEGIRRTLAFYREHEAHYMSPSNACPLHGSSARQGSSS